MQPLANYFERTICGLMARPFTYSRELTDKILAQMAEGMTLREICKQPGMPAPSTVRYWVVQDVDGVAARYARARDAQALHWADEILATADDGSNDWVMRQARDGKMRKELDREHVSRSALRVDARKWLLAKLHPQLFGERVAHQTLGADGKPVDPTKHTITINDDRPVLDGFLVEFSETKAIEHDDSDANK